MAGVQKQLDTARKNLLDLTLRNQQLNFRPLKARSLKILNANPETIFSSLVDEEKQMRFRSLEKNTSDGKTLADSGDYIWSELDNEELYKRLIFIQQKSNLFMEEQGHSILYLALGFLKWRESDESTELSAPLVLVPVELERYRVWKQFRIMWNGNEIITNLSLKEKLLEQDIILPELEGTEDSEELKAYYQAVSEAIKPMKNWKVVPEIYLGFFSFAKFAMYKDLDPQSWPPTNSPIDHPLLNAIYHPGKKPVSLSEYEDEEIDSVTADNSVYYVMDADPSQIQVVEDIKKGHNLVVEGPPGTGKSQTIVNMIAELLARGNKVLFVSEKMAALQVVKERLDQIGLGDYCLELHSHKANKKAVIEELKRSMAKSRPATVSSAEDFMELNDLKAELNAYAMALKTPFGGLQLTPYQLIGRRERITAHFVGREMPRLTIENAETIDPVNLAPAREALRDLDPYMNFIGKAKEHPWYGCEPGIVMPSDQEDIAALVDRCYRALTEMQKTLETFTSITGIAIPTDDEATINSIEAARIMGDAKTEYAEMLLNQAWNEPNAAAEKLIAEISEYRQIRASLQEKMNETAFMLDAATLHREYKDISANFSKYFRPRYYRLKKDISTHYKAKPASDLAIVNDLAALSDCQRRRGLILSADHVGKSLFGAIWAEENSDPAALKSMATWIVLFRKKLLEGIFTDGTVNKMVGQFSTKDAVDAAGKLETAFTAYAEHKKALFSRININTAEIFGAPENLIQYQNLQKKLDIWISNISKIQRWSQYVARRERCRQTVAGQMVPLIESGSIRSGDLVPCFEGNLYDSLLRLIYRRHPIIAEFNGDLHEQKIGRFAAIDRAIIAKNQIRLANLLYTKVPRTLIDGIPLTPENVLNHELNKKTKHIPIRKLLLRAGSVVQKIKPCFMMSPMSIAQFLDPQSISFDIIIFDEASQVKPEDALGAILRGNQVVVLGDSRQLPPTSFFDSMTGAEEDESDEDEVYEGSKDAESVLHLCKLSFPPRSLTWHYRSRHESLIATSNREFYDNGMRIYPSATDQSEDLGLKFVYLPHTIYRRGKNSGNEAEAREVVKAVFEHFKKHPEKSLGVGCFNMNQQRLVEEEIELAVREEPEMEQYFKKDRPEHFFVKNLETIQGDERDVIFISMGFGRDENGKLTMNFGPLNRDGGERRLNVLITRAREKCVVFSNFRSTDLQTDEKSPFGVRALKAFLEYAETRTFPINEGSAEESESPFEEAIYDVLRGNGYEVRRQVGCAGFRVDLAIVNPKAPGEYLVGIECDGWKYHSSAVARDRDRLRQQILERLGWRIVRVWSTDWYHNRVETEQKLLSVIEGLRQNQC